MAMQTEYIYNLRAKKVPDTIGSKAKNLSFLISRKFKIPETYVCTWDAYQDYLRERHTVHTIIRDELSRKIDLSKDYAIRSSANIEDSKYYSFAGQFKSILNVKGLEDILRAIESIWSSTYTKGVKTYLERTGIDLEEIKMAVIIQEMVSPTVSGVSFSKNPLTGMDEIIVEATTGNGDKLLQDGITPERWVHKWGSWVHEPEHASIDRGVIKTVVAKTKEIAASFGNGVDVEWVYDGRSINWVQLREITSLHNTVLYSNHFAREVLPGIIKPLVWTINVPLVCGAWIRLFGELIGRNDIKPFDLAKSFYYRAYFNMGTVGKIFEMLGLPSNTIELLMEVESSRAEKPSFKPTAKTLSLAPRILHFLYQKLRFKHDLETFIPDMRRAYAAFALHDLRKLSAHDLLREVERLYALNEQTAYFMIITYLIMGVFHGLFKHQLKKCGYSFEEFDLTAGMEALHVYDPTVKLDALNSQFNGIDGTIRKKIEEGTYADLLTLEGAEAFRQAVRDFINHFGHLSDSGNDFSSIPWRDNPDAILRMIVHHTRRREETAPGLHFESLTLSRSAKMLLRPLYNQARNYRLYREAVSSLYTYGYGMFRSYFLALGDLLTTRGDIRHPDDIFYLYFDEIKDVIARKTSDPASSQKVRQRKMEIAEYEHIAVPHIIYGDQQPPPITHSTTIMKGIPTSKGVYKGTVRVIKGISDFDKLKDGDVLVIPFSDVGWTPLFSKAAAIIAESGGFLSHSSIVAREYHMPAVVSVAGVCTTLKDDMVVTVDGYRGEISIHQTATDMTREQRST